jgi:hypothetical protein
MSAARDNLVPRVDHGDERLGKIGSVQAISE